MRPGRNFQRVQTVDIQRGDSQVFKRYIVVVLYALCVRIIELQRANIFSSVIFYTMTPCIRYRLVYRQFTAQEYHHANAFRLQLIKIIFINCVFKYQALFLSIRVRLSHCYPRVNTKTPIVCNKCTSDFPA